MTPLAQDLGGVVRLLEKATPGPWHYSEKGFSTKPTPMVYATGQDLNYIAMCRDFGNEGPTMNEENAQAIVASVNFLRTHSAEIAGALRDADGWQPIESAPRDGTLVFLWDAREQDEIDRVAVGKWLGPEDHHSIPGGMWAYRVDTMWWQFFPTHWMPIPDDPNG
jgi:hypothetical protein